MTTADEPFSAFVPLPLPPQDPPVDLGGPVARRLHLATESLARLEATGVRVPSLEWFLYGFVRKEAVISSQIEGTQATLVDLFRADAGQADLSDSDVQEVCNYVAALEYGRRQIAAEGGLPLSMRLLNQVHLRLMRNTRGGHKAPGETRKSQNWIGGSRPGNATFVPPPPERVEGLLSDLERYLHADDPIPPLVRAGLAHVQFETIHPYLDGNGRVGRLLVTLLLEHWGLLSKPLLYLSLHFKRHRAEYYRRLDAVRTDGDWEGWLDFFLDGVATIGDEASEAITDLAKLVDRDRKRVLEIPGRSSAAIRLFGLLPQHPIVTAKSVSELLDVSTPTAGRVLDLLVGAQVLAEASGRRRDRWFLYRRYVERLARESS